MIDSIFSTLSKVTGLSTYKIGLLQTKAYRTLNQETAKILKPHGITPVDWALLGLVYESPDGMRLSHLAQELGVEAPFITEQSESLIKQNLIQINPTKEDKRVKLMTLTDQARKMIPKIEKELVANMLPLLKGSTMADLRGYRHVLNNIVNNKPSK
jgi:DNA-binding MarR family transcriptional regulator